MDGLPGEIAHLIINQLDTAHGPHELPSIPLKNLKALRLTCRLFAGLVPNYLYRDLWVYMDLTTLRLIPNSLKILPALLSADLLARDEYDRCVKEITFAGECPEQWGFDADGTRCLSPEELDHGYSQYVSLLDLQSAAHAKVEDTLEAAIVGLGALSWISLGFAGLSSYFPCRIYEISMTQDSTD